ncbi:hypothetical protein HanHA300_Chr13g0467491 [Helianthus annuus]|nr:hypothetical protein HanHA300_Chr13g0467491 [Helianthus annuus]KAJ0496394.1 hypothetical protein HanHA89_Chr13g0499221 [Helianthus annuus]KAJ0662454.1 hypothetical protein HanLR1_Chr13g0469661 [Helianthus annuus]
MQIDLLHKLMWRRKDLRDCKDMCVQWRSLRFSTGGRKRIHPKISIEPWGRKHIHLKISIRKSHILHY